MAGLKQFLVGCGLISGYILYKKYYLEFGAEGGYSQDKSVLQHYSYNTGTTVLSKDYFHCFCLALFKNHKVKRYLFAMYKLVPATSNPNSSDTKKSFIGVWVLIRIILVVKHE